MNPNNSSVQYFRAEPTDPEEQYANIPMPELGQRLAGSAMSRGMISGFSSRPRLRGLPNPLDKNTSGSTSYRGQ
jgi:hypothetical protein